MCSRATDRVVRPFEWGLEWTREWPCARLMPRNGHDPQGYLGLLNRASLESSDDFFGYEPPTDFKLEGNLLRFTSAVSTPYPENNIVHGQWFPARIKPGARRVAVIVLPHWNASVTQHNALCKGLAKLGFQPCASAFLITITACRPNSSAPISRSPRTWRAPSTLPARRSSTRAAQSIG
ncbi:MAG TPA: hypothetical protein VK687_04060 [Bryobacteraceae bacterium]|nr:hypothetical protein [Bryobacteraceae bacterium]